MTSAQDRAAGALYGLAIGDALGMPTESMPRAAIVARYGPLLDEFQPGGRRISRWPRDCRPAR